MKKIYAIILTAFLLIPALVSAQDFVNKKVNQIITGDQNTDGGNSIAIGGGNIYILWADFQSSYYSYVSRSTDGGSTFINGVKAGTTEPHIFGGIAADNSGSVYVVWDGIVNGNIGGVYFAKSTDVAATFSIPVLISSVGVFPQVAFNGSNVYVMFIKVKDTGKVGCFFARSVDGGATFATPYEITDGSAAEAKFDTPCSMTLDGTGNIYCTWNDGRRPGSGSDIFVAKSTDAGASFSSNVMVNGTSTNSSQIRTGPSIAVTGSNVYITWRQEDDAQGSNRKIYFAKSADGGLNFSDALEIAQGGFGSPALALNAAGEIYLAYPNVNGTQTGLFCSKSNDGGASFPVTVFISSVNADAKNVSIAVDSNDKLNAVWTDSRDGNEDIYFARGQITITDIDEDALPVQFSLNQNYPNPFNPSTTINFQIPVTKALSGDEAHVTLKIYDVLGREVAVLVNEDKAPGNYSVNFNAPDLPSGIYLCQLKSDNFSQSIKLVLMK